MQPDCFGDLLYDYYNCSNGVWDFMEYCKAGVLMTTATARKSYRKESIIIHSGVTKEVLLPFCPSCGREFDKSVRIQTTATRFKCPFCHVSIENTRQNRCPTCGILSSDGETAKVHRWGGCPNVGKVFPMGLIRRGEV